MEMDALFWNVETHYDFMRKEGGLYVPNAEIIEPALARITEVAKMYNVKVLNSGDSHDKNSHELAEKPDYAKTWPAHCIPGTWGAEYIPATKPEDAYLIDWRNKALDEKLVLAKRNLIVTKDHTDMFNKEHGSPHIDRVLELLMPKRVFVYGVAADVCVDYAVKGLMKRGKDVYVVEDAIKALADNFDAKKQWPDATIVRTDDLEALLR
jgi:nicotinamidase/pyrazinamidase